MAKKKSKSKIILFSILGVLIVAIGGGIAMFGNKDKSVMVTVEQVKRRTITQTVSATGKIKPETLVKISSEASGEIIFLGAKEGDVVKKGQLLVRIKPDLVETQLEQFKASADASKASANAAKSDFERSQGDLERVASLFKKEFASKEEFERAKSAVEQGRARYEASLKDYERSQAAYKQAQVSASRTAIYSPIDGVVVSKTVEQGDKVVGTAQMQGTEMMQIADLSVINAVVDVDENDVVLISVGDTARIKVDAIPDKVYIGKVYQIANSAKASKLGTQDETVNFEIRIRILEPDNRFRPGMSCNADIETETRQNVLAVPLQAVTVRAEDVNKNPDVTEVGLHKEETIKKKTERPPSVVFLNENGKAKLTKVEAGISDNGYIEIKSGLNEGVSVISGSFKAVSKELEDGSTVKLDTAKFKKKFDK